MNNTADPLLELAFKHEVMRYQRLYPRATVADIAEHFNCDTSARGIKLIQEILSAPEMRRYRPGIESGNPVRRINWSNGYTSAS